MTRVFIHPLAGVLSAYGMGLADQVAMRSRAVEARLEDCSLEDVAEALAIEARDELVPRACRADKVRAVRRAHLKYEGTDTALVVPLGSPAEMRQHFEAAYRKQFSFLMPGKPLVAEAVSVEAIGRGRRLRGESLSSAKKRPNACRNRSGMFTGGALARGAALSPRGARPGQPHRRPGDHRRGERDHGGRAGLARHGHAAEPSGARTSTPRKAARRGRHHASTR